MYSGSSVNIECDSDSERITYDNHDDDATDFVVTVRCLPNEEFDLPEDGLPECKAWCPAEKPTPPPETGLQLLPEHNNDK